MLVVMPIERGTTMRARAVVLAAALVLAPVAVKAADLVVWWYKGFYEQEDAAVREIIVAFEQKTGKQVELVQPDLDVITGQANAAIEAGQPPDFLFPLLSTSWIPRWAYEDRLADLAGPLEPVLDLFDADAIEGSMLLNGRTGQRALYALPMARSSNFIHVWSSLLERAGFTLADVPQGWEAFWSFWCDQVQPAVRKAMGRDDIWGVGLAMSAKDSDTIDEVFQFQLAYDSPWLAPDGHLRVDDPATRTGMVEALRDYTAIYRKGCTPPDAPSWGNIDNNKAFLAQKVVMTANTTLSIPGALRTTHPDDYYQNAATIEWPQNVHGQPLVLLGTISRAVVFKAGRNVSLAGAFVRFLAEGGWLAHWLDFAGDRYLPPMRKLVEQPFWLDTSDPHRMRAAIQILSRQHQLEGGVRDKEWRSGRIWDENVWGKAVQRVAADGITPEQAVDEAIVRIKQILSE
jgi:multiple sugar transport system substrate-binding protein